jgi:amino acid adenylation domain-containing protein
MLALDGKTKSFDASADGYVRGEGAAAIVIKRLSDVIAGAEQASILAVIRGSVLNQDGRSASLTAPNGSSQRKLLRSALHRSGVTAKDVLYLETHGTGTKLGDPIEFGAIKDVYLNDGSGLPLVIGAVKTNIGHLEAAAGLAGVVKAVLCLQNRMVPANLNFVARNPLIPSQCNRPHTFPSMNCELVPYENCHSIFVGVSSFGSGGTNGHVILESAPGNSCTVDTPAVVMAADKKCRLAFVFSGQGSAYCDMGLAFYQAEPSFRDTVNRVSAAVCLTPALSEVMFHSSFSTVGSEVACSFQEELVYQHLSHYALQVALVALWKTRGVECTVVCGHSLGEFAGLVTAGAVSVEDGAKLVLKRAEFIASLAPNGNFGMFAFRCGLEDLMGAISELPGSSQSLVFVAAINSKQTTVLSGDIAVIECVGRLLDVVYKKLPLEVPYHSRFLAEVAGKFRTYLDSQAAARELVFSPLSCEFVSCLKADFVDSEQLSTGSYWEQQMLSTVDFVGCVTKLSQCVDIAIELGPHPQLTKFGPACIGESRMRWLPSMEKASNAVEFFNESVNKVLSYLSIGRLGGRLHPGYSPQPMPWRRLKSQSCVGLSVVEPSGSLSVTEIVTSAIMEVLLPSARKLLTDDSSIFSLGIDSLAAVTVRNRLCKQLGVSNLPGMLLIMHPSVRKITDFIKSAMLEGERVQAKPEQATEAPLIFPTTSMQRGMLFHHLSDPGAGVFLATFVWNVTGMLNVSAFRQAWIHVADNISALRSSLDVDSIPVANQIVAESFNADYKWFTVKDMPTETGILFRPDIFIRDRIFEERGIGVDLAHPLPFRVCCIRCNNTCDYSFVVLFTVFHAFIDGWSMRTVLNTLSDAYIFTTSDRFYRDENTSYEPKTAADSGFHIYAEYENSLVNGYTEGHRRYCTAARSYWQRVLVDKSLENISPLKSGIIPKIDCSDFNVVRYEIPLECVNIVSAAHLCSVTVASFIQTAWCLTYSTMLVPLLDEPNVHIWELFYGCTVSGRSAVVNGRSADNIVGPLINTIPVRLQLRDSDSVISLIRSIHAYMVDCLAFENFPLASILQNVTGKHRMGSAFDVVFDFQTQTWDCPLSEDDQIFMQSSYLLDRVGVPVSCRVVHNNDVFILKATSECLAFGEVEVKNLLSTFKCFIVTLTELILSAASAGGNDILGSPSVGSVLDDMGVVYRSTRPDFQQHTVLFPVLPTIGGIPVYHHDHEECRFDGNEYEQMMSTCRLLHVELTDLIVVTLATAIFRFCQEGALKFHIKHTALGGNFCRLVSFENISCEAPFRHVFDVIKNSPPLRISADLYFGVNVYMVDAFPADGSFPLSDGIHLFASTTAASLKVSVRFCDSSLPAEVCSGIIGCIRCLLSGCLALTDGRRLDDLVPVPAPVIGTELPFPLIVPSVLLNSVVDNALIQPGTSTHVSVITESGRHITHCQLFSMSSRVAESLLSATTNHDTLRDVPNIVAIIMNKGWEQIVAALGILKAHCAYLPIDAKLWPEKRIRQVLELSSAVAVVTQQELLQSDSMRWLSHLAQPVVAISPAELSNSLSAEHQIALPKSSLMSPQSLAYVIYTSGSTGVPKGVCCHHVGALNTIADLNERFNITSKDRVLALSSLGFDLSVYDIFGLLSVGGTIVVPPAASLSPPDPQVWLQLIIQQQVTIWNAVPAFMELLVSFAECSHNRLPPCLRLIFMSGDWIPVTLPSRIRALSDCKDLRIISMGGATEAAIWSNIFELGTEGTGIPDGWSSVPYGRPMRNQTMYVLNERMEHCETWVTGGIYIGGVGVANGYYRNPERTADQFVTHPQSGEKLFRTGDLGRVRPGGLIEILGREDLQVKVNGFRIELGEIEKVLSSHLAVLSAALAVHGNLLCAYLVLRENSEGGVVEDIKDVCRSRLAEYMVPHHFVVLDELPLSSNGKVDRLKLPKPASVGLLSNPNFVEATTPLEQTMQEIFGTVLNIDCKELSVNSNFFSLGGDSLRTVQVIAQARKRGIVLTIPQMFEFPTIRELAEVCVASGQSGPAVLGTSSEGVGLKPIFEICSDVTISGTYPLIGINQAHFVGLHTSSFTEGGLAPQIYFEWMIGDDQHGRLDVAKFENAINVFIRRHHTFQSIITTDGRMKLLEMIPLFKIASVYEGSGADDAASHADIVRKEMMGVGPNAYSWPLFEVRVTHLSQRQSVVHLTVSLFLMDAMSDLILRQELSALYRADSDTPHDQVLPPPAQITFPNYCYAMDTELPKSTEYIAARQYWMLRLPQLYDGPQLPLFHSTHANLAEKTGTNEGKFCNQHRWLSESEWARARNNCSSHAVTMPAVLLAAYCLALSRWSANCKFLINILQCLRHQVHEDVNKLVGNCSSTILCNVDLSPPAEGSLTFKVVILRLAQELSQNLQHASFSGVEVMQELNRIKGNTFQAVAPFIFTTPIGVEKGNHQVQSRNWMFQERFFSERVPHTACVNAIKSDPSGTACASLDIVEGAFPAEVVRGVFEDYSMLLDLICAESPKQWNLPVNQFLNKSKVVECDVSSIRAPPTGLLHQISEQVISSDTAIFDASTKAEIHYTKLEILSDRIACMLAPISAQWLACSRGEPAVVAVVMEKGWEQVVAVLGILKARCAYLPVDVKLWPENRIRQVLDLSEAVAIVTQEAVLQQESTRWISEVNQLVVTLKASDLENDPSDGLYDGQSFESGSFLGRVNSMSMAYLIYTSGSTGIPKGVCCHHEGAMNTIADLNERFSVTPKDKVLALSSLGFDLSVYDIFGLLSAGGTVIMPPANSVSPPDPQVWLQLIIQQQVTIWNAVPAFMELLVSFAECSHNRLPPCLRLIFMSGDWIPVTLPSRIRALSDCKDLRIISMGGATEAAIWSNIFELGTEGTGIPDGWSSVPYGRPMRNQTMYVLNERMEHCETWVTGGIYIGGVGVANGYYRNPERTADQFVTHPQSGEKLFRTGDLGRVRPGGLIEILGREDLQVKVNGFRIELGEIEKVILAHGNVSSAGLAVYKNSLCAYLVLRDTSLDCVSEVRQICRLKLADYMVPQHFMVIDSLPLSSNGKVQQDKLPNPFDLAAADSRVGAVAGERVLPRSTMETALLDAFSEVLRIDKAIICCDTSSFFELGGNSLTAIQLMFLIRRKLSRIVSPQDFFRSPYVAGITQLLQDDSSLVPVPAVNNLELCSCANSDSSLARQPAFKKAVNLLILQKGPETSPHPPVFVVNPAGSSALW